MYSLWKWFLTLVVIALLESVYVYCIRVFSFRTPHKCRTQIAGENSMYIISSLTRIRLYSWWCMTCLFLVPVCVSPFFEFWLLVLFCFQLCVWVLPLPTDHATTRVPPEPQRPPTPVRLSPNRTPSRRRLRARLLSVHRAVPRRLPGPPDQSPGRPPEFKLPDPLQPAQSCPSPLNSE